jgi:hypothetical protein
VALIAVLGGAPVAAVICAEWCAPSDHAGHAQAHSAALSKSHAPAERTSAPDCHGKAVGTGPALAADLKPECADYGLTWRDARPIALLLQLAPVVSATPIASALHSPGLVRAEGSVLRLAHASPPRPIPAGSVLRI